MEAGILIIFLLLGTAYSYDTKEENINVEQVSPKSVIEEIKKIEKEQIDNRLKQINNYNHSKITNERYFKNNYQLQIKQYNFIEGKKKLDSIINMGISSADIYKFIDNYNEAEDKNVENKFKILTQFIPNNNENEFLMDYSLYYEEKTKYSNFKINKNDQIKLYLNKPLQLNYKNIEYNISLTKINESKTYENVEYIKCQENIPCLILQENTINFKKENSKNNENKNEIIKKEKLIKTEENKSQEIFFKSETINYPEKRTHKVEKGETLSLLASYYKVPVKLIKSLNKLENNNIKVGQDLLINNKNTIIHKVGTGENLYRLSKKYNLKISTIKELNKLKNDVLYEGSYIVIKK